MSTAPKPQRSFRFPPSPRNTTVTLRASGGQDGVEQQLVGMVLNESRGGFGAIFVHHELVVGQVWLADLAGGPREPAIVRWVSQLAPHVYQAGFAYTR